MFTREQHSKSSIECELFHVKTAREKNFREWEFAKTQRHRMGHYQAKFSCDKFAWHERSELNCTEPLTTRVSNGELSHVLHWSLREHTL